MEIQHENTMQHHYPVIRNKTWYEGYTSFATLVFLTHYKLELCIIYNRTQLFKANDVVS